MFETKTTITIPAERYEALVRAETQRDIIACAAMKVTDYRLAEHVKITLGMVDQDKANEELKGETSGA